MITDKIHEMPTEVLVVSAAMAALLLVVAICAAVDAGLFTSPSVSKHRATLRGVNTTMLNELDRDLAAHPGPIPAHVVRAHHAAHRAHKVTRHRLNQRQLDASLKATFQARDAFDEFSATATSPATTYFDEESAAA